MKHKTYSNWQLTLDDDHILWLNFDRENSSTNTISEVVLDELDDLVDDIAQDSSLRGVIFCSAKKNGFIAGADIKHFTELDNTHDAVAFLRKGQIIFDKIENLRIPTVAMIQGFCMGGGTELSLACRYRVAQDDDKTRIGLPEILLGIHPGWGGTVRLPNLIGPIAALDLILTGRSLRARAAAKLGMIDAAVPERQLRRAARQFILHQPSPQKASWFQQLLSSSILRPLLAKIMRHKVAKKAKKEHYPAPYAVIDNWERDGAQGESAQLAEADSIGNLIVHNNTAKNLVRIFFLQERLKSFAKASDFTATHVHVIGAGVMGGDIAAWCALRGFTVTLQDREAKFIGPAIQRAYKLYKKKLKKPRLIQATMDRLIADVGGFGVAKADVIIEAIFENLDAKQALFKRLEEQAKPSAILASNTSSIPLDEINSVMHQPQRLVGIHFFNPVPMMPLVEVVRGDKTGDKIMANAQAFVKKIGKLPLPVKSSPGFLVNRVLMPYLMEAMALLEEGVPGPVIDKAAMDFGMPMGPVELADTAGLDVCLSVATNLTQHYGGHIPERLRQMVTEGRLGRKTNKGFYEYKNNKAVKGKVDNSLQRKDIADRLILRMVNEAAACLREQVVADADLLDAGMIFGTGFAPFRGGPMHYAHSFGEDQLNDLFNQLAQQYGDRFKADMIWKA